MGLFSKLFKSNKKDVGDSFSQSLPTLPSGSTKLGERFLSVHNDIKDLIWIGDGKFKNYLPKTQNNTFIEINGIKYYLSHGNNQEPSLISTKIPVANFNPNANVENLPYYPRYSDITSYQRGLYWQFLSNPYDNRYEIGYVFLLYYGLERHLLEGNYEHALRVILKLRDVHSHKSFQFYSSRAIILSCLYHQRPDLLIEFIRANDKDYEQDIPTNLLLMVKSSLGIPLEASEIIRCSKDFEFTNKNYIKKYPELFVSEMNECITQKYGQDTIDLTVIYTTKVIKTLALKDEWLFANMSISNEQIKVPDFLGYSHFKKDVFDILKSTHNSLKQKLPQLRKAGIVVDNKATKKNKEVAVFDDLKEQELLNRLKQSKNNLMERHFVYLELQNFYYKNRNAHKGAIENCIKYCILDIDSLEDMNQYYINSEIRSIKSLSYMSTHERQEQITRIKKDGFKGNIPAFKRLAIIYEKQKEYQKAIDVCKRAISYGQLNDGSDGGFKGRIDKLSTK